MVCETWNGRLKRNNLKSRVVVAVKAEKHVSKIFLIYKGKITNIRKNFKDDRIPLTGSSWKKVREFLQQTKERSCILKARTIPTKLRRVCSLPNNLVLWPNSKPI